MFLFLRHYLLVTFGPASQSDYGCLTTTVDGNGLRLRDAYPVQLVASRRLRQTAT